jgi:Golgi apparatus protein 1
LFDEEVRFSENIDFQYPMKKACEKELTRFCKDVSHGNARVIRCLQDNKEEKDFGKACLQEVKRYENLAAKDYRLNHRLNKECKDDVDKLCKDICRPKDGEVCGGKVRTASE